MSGVYDLNVFSIPSNHFVPLATTAPFGPPSPEDKYGFPSKASSFWLAFDLTFERKSIYLLFLSNDCSSIQAWFVLGILIVSRGKTPLSVAFAIANFPFSPTAFHPPNSVISFTVPGSTFFSSPRVFISFTFALFSITSGRFFNALTNVPKLASALGAV